MRAARRKAVYPGAALREHREDPRREFQRRAAGVPDLVEDLYARA